MSRTGLRIPLEALFGTAVAATVVAMTLRAGSVATFAGTAGALRFPLLALAAATAVAYAIVYRPPLVIGTAAYPLAGLAVLGLASAFWSADPVRSLAYGAAFAAVSVAAIVGAAIAVTTPSFARALMGGIAAGASAIAVGGVVLLVVDTNLATFVLAGPHLQRFRGLGANTNTVASLAAVTVGPAIWLCTLERRATRLAAFACVLLLAATVVASGARGSAVALVAALAVAAALLGRPSRLRVPLAGLAAAVVLGVLLGADERVADAFTAPPAAPATSFLAASQPPTPTRPPHYPGNPGRLEAELGSDNVGFSSGRLEAWRGAAETALDRPLAGFGLGTERRAFVDRYAGFQGVYVENSFVGTLLELGIAGVAALLATLIAAALAAARVHRIADQRHRELAACCAASTAAGVVLAVVMSYLLTAGNLVTLPFWMAALLLSAVASGAPLRRPGRRAGAAAIAALALVAAFGSVQGSHHTERQRDRVADLARASGPLDGRRLASFRLTTLLTCFGYDFGRTAWDVETCYDREGRLVDAIDRRGREPQFATLRFAPDRAPVRRSPEEIRRLLDRSGGLVLARLFYGGYPTDGLVDSTPIVIEEWLPVARAAAPRAPDGTA